MNPAYLLFGLVGALIFYAVVSIGKAAWRRRERVRSPGQSVDLTVVSASLGDPGLHDTVWMETVLSAVLPDGQSRRIRASIRVHLDRVEEIEPGFRVPGRLDPHDADIRLEADHLAERLG